MNRKRLKNLKFILANLPVVILILCVSSFISFAQSPIDDKQVESSKEKSVVVKKKVKSPLKASLMSAALPGLGQVYNNKYWKLPIIYAGMGAFGYAYIKNKKGYDQGIEEYRLSGQTNSSALNIAEEYRRNMELSAIGFAVVYLLNIIDANVDAHLHSFDISDDLSLDVNPQIENIRGEEHLGLGVALRFK